MPGSFTDFAENMINNAVFGGQAMKPPATWQVGLTTTPYNKFGVVTEPSGGGYARFWIASNLTNFTVSSKGANANRVPITFPVPISDWGLITGFFFADNANNIWVIVDLLAPKSILVGVAPTIAIGAFQNTRS
jgi:hypothetical protein